MGLGIYIEGKITKPSLSVHEQFTDLQRIQKYITGYSSGLFREFLSFEEGEDILYVKLHPCEEPLEFEQSSGTVVFSAKTNGVGPGYHAYLVELIEKMGRDLDISWEWGQPDEDDQQFSDETGYYNNRDFAALQVEMLHWLNALARSLSEEKEAVQFMISFPQFYPRIRPEYFAASPLAIWTKDWFTYVADNEPGALTEIGEEFFIWWNKEPDALFYKMTGIALLNIECPWHFPANEREQNIYQWIDRCFYLAREADHTISLPEEDWKAVRQFLAEEEEAHIPETDYGYKKNLMTFDLAGDWLIDLPGTFYYAVDEETEIFYDHLRIVRNTGYSVNNKETSDEVFAEDFFDPDDYPGAEEVYSDRNVAGKAVIYYCLDKEAEEEYWMLQGIRVENDKFIFSTICYPADEFKDWAIETWNSIRR